MTKKDVVKSLTKAMNRASLEDIQGILTKLDLAINTKQLKGQHFRKHGTGGLQDLIITCRFLCAAAPQDSFETIHTYLIDYIDFLDDSHSTSPSYFFDLAIESATNQRCHD